MDYFAVIFDFDGLMIESEKIALRVWKEVVATFGVDMKDDVNQLLIGKSPEVAVNTIRDLYNLPMDASALQEVYWQRRTDQMCKESVPVEGLLSLIEFLVERKIRLGVASNSPTNYVEQVLLAIQLNEMMECIVGSDQVSAAKPAPDVYLEAAKRLGIEPAKIIALEDSPTGVTAAIKAGMTCYAIPNEDLLEEDFSEAHLRFDSMVDLHNHLKNVLHS
jgi:sugar-phosphatase